VSYAVWLVLAWLPCLVFGIIGGVQGRQEPCPPSIQLLVHDVDDCVTSTRQVSAKVVAACELEAMLLNSAAVNKEWVNDIDSCADGTFCPC
jgi:hypothetical protein